MSTRIVKVKAALVPKAKMNSFLLSAFSKPAWEVLLQLSLHRGGGLALPKDAGSSISFPRQNFLPKAKFPSQGSIPFSLCCRIKGMRTQENEIGAVALRL